MTSDCAEHPLGAVALARCTVAARARAQRHLGALATIRTPYFRPARGFARAAPHLGAVASVRCTVRPGPMSRTTVEPWRLPGARW